MAASSHVLSPGAALHSAWGPESQEVPPCPPLPSAGTGRYSVFCHRARGDAPAYRLETRLDQPEPKKKYQVIIVGAGGQIGDRLYLGRKTGITDVAVIEKGWLGGGNTGATPPSSAAIICRTLGGDGDKALEALRKPVAGPELQHHVQPARPADAGADRT